MKNISNLKKRKFWIKKVCNSILNIENLNNLSQMASAAYKTGFCARKIVYHHRQKLTGCIISLPPINSICFLLSVQDVSTQYPDLSCTNKWTKEASWFSHSSIHICKYFKQKLSTKDKERLFINIRKIQGDFSFLRNNTQLH